MITPRLALASHYRRHPWQLLALVLMIVLATMLWTGIHHLTSQARVSLSQGETALAERQQVLRTDGNALTVADFVFLRQQGVCVMPWLEVTVPGRGRIVGLDPLAASCFEAGDGRRAPWQGALDGKPFVDIAEAAAAATPDNQQLRLLVAGMHGLTTAPAGYRFAELTLAPDTRGLGESFLLNLDALGVLVLLITALLLRSVFLLGLSQRRESLALLQAYGVPRSQLRRLLMQEQGLLALVCVLPGVWLGKLLAGLLGQGFSRALDGLFDTPLYAVEDGGWLMPGAIMLLVVSAAGFAGVRQARAQTVDARWLWLAGLVLLGGLALAALAPGLNWVFLAVALVFAGAGVLTPALLARLAAGVSSRRSSLQLRWRWRELSVLTRQLALPLVALQFALAMVLAVQALVATFENTFEHWLEAAPGGGLLPGAARQRPGATGTGLAVTTARRALASGDSGPGQDSRCHWPGRAGRCLGARASGASGGRLAIAADSAGGGRA